jgi:hypothetical protein
MNKTKRLLVTCGVLTGMFLIGSLMNHPDSQAKGAYATPVAITNTTSAPGIVLDANAATRIPYTSTRIINTCSGLQNCALPLFTTVPAGYQLVVENVGGILNVSTTSPPIAGYLEDFNFGAGIQTFVGLNAPLGGTGFNGQSFAGMNEKVLAFFPAGESPFVVVYGNFLNGFPQGITVSGYLENCAVVGCPAIQR